jgi:hypothetical protein
MAVSSSLSTQRTFKYIRLGTKSGLYLVDGLLALPSACMRFERVCLNIIGWHNMEQVSAAVDVIDLTAGRLFTMRTAVPSYQVAPG